MEMKVGMKVWMFDPNHRVYVDDNGVRHTSPIYRKHFVEYYIIGETRVSWILSRSKDGDVKKGVKIKKSEADTLIFISEEELDKHCWVVENKYKIARAVETCSDYNIMKKIAEMLNLEL
jgi:hypothetical protein